MKKFFWIALTLIMLPISAYSLTIHVPADYITIQSAIDIAQDGDIILVANGSFWGDGNRNLDFKGKKITVKSKNGPTKTTIDCKNNVRAFIFKSGEANESIVSGFTIKNGNSSNGGGIYCNNSSPIIKNCIFTKNSANNGAGIYCDNSSSPIIMNCVFIRNWVGNGNGGGIYCNSSSPKIINCTITKNTNGGVYNNQYSYPTIKNCIIWGNHWYGISNYKWDVSPIVTYSNVQGGYSGAGNINANPLFVGVGDYYHLAEGSPCIDSGTSVSLPYTIITDIDDDNRFQGSGYDIGADEWINAKLNTPPIINVPGDFLTIQTAINEASDGTIIEVADGTYTGDDNRELNFYGKHLILRSKNGPTKTIIDCNENIRAFIFQNGEMDDTIISGFTIKNGNSSSGGGIYLSISSPTITNCIFINNKASNGAGMYLNLSRSTITNCVFIRNWVGNGNGGGIYCNSSSPKIINCTITKNTNGGIYNNQYSYPTIKNCIIWGNHWYGISNYKWDVSPSVTYSNVQGGYSGAGNINANPLFVGIGDYYHLAEGSPCIDSGTSVALPYTIIADIDNDNRLQGSGGRISKKGAFS